MNKLYFLLMLIHMNTMFGMSKLATPSKQILALEVLHAAIRNFSTAAKKDQLLFKTTPQLWASFFDKAIRRKILNKKFYREECEDYQWIVKDKTGAIWDSYDKPAVIKFIREKLNTESKLLKTTCLYEYKNQFGEVYIHDLTRNYEDPWFFDHNNDFFQFECNQDRMRFWANYDPKYFAMKVNIDDKKVTRLESDKIELLKHLDLKIPYGLALKGTINYTWEPIRNHQKLEWTSLSDNGQNIITKLHDGGYYLWSIEHLSNKLTQEQLAKLSSHSVEGCRPVGLAMLKQMENKT